MSDPAEAARIRQIEAEEWHHRDLVGGLLAAWILFLALVARFRK